MFKSGNIIGEIVNHLPNGEVEVNYGGTLLTLPESDNEFATSDKFVSGGRIDTTRIKFQLNKVTELTELESASAIECLNGILYIIGDDATHIMVADAALQNKELIRLFQGHGRIPKMEKADLEASAIINKGDFLHPERYLLVMGSASLPQREKIIVAPIENLQAFKNMSTEVFAGRIRKKGITELNIEGMSAVAGVAVVMSNRGNRGNPQNHLIVTEPNFYENQQNCILQIIKVDLGIEGMGISGMCYLANRDLLLFTASNENTPDAVQDGAIGDSYIGWFSNMSQRLSAKELSPDMFMNLAENDARFKGQKIEGICVENHIGTSKTHYVVNMVADNDDGSSKVFEAQINIPAPKSPKGDFENTNEFGKGGRILYHGTSAAPFEKFNVPLVYLVNKKDRGEADIFALNQMVGGGGKKAAPRIITVKAPTGKTKNVSSQVEDFIFEEDGGSSKNLDEFIEQLAEVARKEGYEYLSFEHPSSIGETDFTAWVALHPEKLEIVSEQKLEKGGPVKTYYSTHGSAMSWDEFIEIEVNDRGNYPLEYINEWKAKYKIPDSAKLVWVATTPQAALTYNCYADSHDDIDLPLEEFEKKWDCDRKDLVEFTDADGFLITESDDGDKGFLMVLNESFNSNAITKILFHGSGKKKNEVYNGPQDHSLGKFYTNNRTMAEWFAGAVEFNPDKGKYVKTHDKSAVVEEKLISLQNPMIINDMSFGYDIDNDKDSVQIYFDEIKKYGGADAYKSRLQENGYDGIILKDNNTNYYNEGTYDIWITFDKWEKGGKLLSRLILYHGTSSVLLPEIKKHGLKNPYLTNIESKARYYAEEAVAETGGNIIVLEMELKSDKNLRVDKSELDEPVVVEGMGSRAEVEKKIERAYSKYTKASDKDYQLSLSTVNSVKYEGTISAKEIFGEYGLGGIVNNSKLTFTDAKGKSYSLPSSHVPFMAVPSEGANCTNCLHYLNIDKPRCALSEFVDYTGSSELPSDPENWCSDWYTPSLTARLTMRSTEIKATGQFNIPPGENPFIRVADGGSSCASCKFLSDDKKHCGNQSFVEYYGKSELPASAQELCSDWYEPAEKLLKVSNVKNRKHKLADGGYVDTWMGYHKARHVFTRTDKPKTLAGLEMADKKEEALNDIEEYYEGFTESSVKRAMIQSRIRDYGGGRKIGIMAKAEPYANQFSIGVYGIVGGYDVEITDRGHEMDLAEGAYTYHLSKSYQSNLPDKEELINDFAVLDLLAAFPAKAEIIRDASHSLVYPTAKELFETGYKTMGGDRIEPISEDRAVELYNSGAVEKAIADKTAANEKLPPSAKNSFQEDLKHSIGVDEKKNVDKKTAYTWSSIYPEVEIVNKWIGWEQELITLEDFLKRRKNTIGNKYHVGRNIPPSPSSPKQNIPKFENLETIGTNVLINHQYTKEQILSVLKKLKPGIRYPASRCYMNFPSDCRWETGKLYIYLYHYYFLPDSAEKINKDDMLKADSLMEFEVVDFIKNKTFVFTAPLAEVIITSAKKQRISKGGYKMFRSLAPIGESYEYRVEFSDGSHFTESTAESNEEAKENAWKRWKERNRRAGRDRIEEKLKTLLRLIQL